MDASPVAALVSIDNSSNDPMEGALLKDRYDNDISTSSSTARDRYIDAVDALLAGQPDMVSKFEKTVEADPGFALGHCGLARARMISGDIPAARTAMQQARALSAGVPAKQAAHINAVGLLVEGKPAEAYRAVLSHADDYPRDVLVAQICTSVFGLIGFSGQPGREAELLAYTAKLLPHYGEDWWCLSQHAFSLCETGQIDRASAMIDLSLKLNPQNAHGAHVRSHLYYEAGSAGTGTAYLTDWLKDYNRQGLLHGHLSWHAALWALEEGDGDLMWQIVDENVVPGVAKGIPLIVLTDTASILYRAELAGEKVSVERWQAISEYARQFFPKASIAFADVHAALAHAMAGDGDALQSIISAPAGPAASLVSEFAQAYQAVAGQRWADATRHLSAAMADHARIGGSRAQRDVLELTLLGALLKQGCGEEARRLLTLRRPNLAQSAPVCGLRANS